MSDSRHCLVNGRPDDSISIDDRGLSYGDGLFETIAVRCGTVRLLSMHLARLRAGCLKLGLPEPDDSTLTGEIARVVDGQLDGVVKILVTRGGGARGYGPPERPTPTRIVRFFEGSPVDAAVIEAGARVVSCVTPASVNHAIAGLKTLNRLDNVLARRECQQKGADEGLMFGPAGDLVGGTMSNVFLWHGGRLATPVLDHAGVRGIMREVVMKVANGAGLRVAEITLTTREIDGAEEVFLTNALRGVWPVRSIDDRQYRRGAVTEELSRLVAGATFPGVT